ncbi:hypothetical protein [Streptomyces agglomeratus]|nr:hypothetical protein [Streptomyces agglomeratus]
MKKPKWITVAADRIRLSGFKWTLTKTLESVAGGLIGAVIGLILVTAWIR